MAKTAFVLILAMVLLISIHTVFGTEDNILEAASDAAAIAKDAAGSISESAARAFEQARAGGSEWNDWFTGKLNAGAATESIHTEKDPDQTQHNSAV